MRSEEEKVLHGRVSTHLKAQSRIENPFWSIGKG